MPKINEQGVIEFDNNDIEAAWENSIKIVNKDSNQERMCYLCNFIFKKNNYQKVSNKELAWVIDFINIKKLNKNLTANNLIGIHLNCFEKVERAKPNMTREILKIKAMLWKFND